MLTVVICQIPELQIFHVAELLNDIFLIFPNFALGMGIVDLSTNFQLNKQCTKELNLEFICDAFPDNICCSKGTSPSNTLITIYVSFFFQIIFCPNFSEKELSGLGAQGDWEKRLCIGTTRGRVNICAPPS